MAALILFHVVAYLAGGLITWLCCRSAAPKAKSLRWLVLLWLPGMFSRRLQDVVLRDV